jgi:hypothetical protein
MYLADISSSGEKSSIMLGGHDIQRYTDKDDFIYLRVPDQKGYWSLPLTAIKVEGTFISQTSPRAVLDSGSSVFLGPRSEVDEIWSLIAEGNA